MAVVDSIFAHARTAPHKPALIYDGRSVGYGDFAARIAAMGGFLNSRSIARDRVAMICANHVVDAWIIGLALRGLGVTTVHGRSAQDIGWLWLGDVSLVSAGAESWPGMGEATARAGWPLITTPGDLETTAPGPSPALRTQSGGHILLTSGTTGASKKVLVAPAHEAGNVTVRTAVLDVSADSVIDLVDFGGWTAMGHQWPVCVWTLGGTVVLHQGPDRFRSLSAPGLTHIMTQPQLLAELLDASLKVSLRNEAAMLVVGTGVLSLAQWRMARERITGDVRVLVGSTEAGNFTPTRIEAPEDLGWHHVVRGCELLVVDDQDNVQPPGRIGAVRVRTTGVDEYLGDQETSRAFFRGGWFYPGDLGLLRDDGRLALQGRNTDVINVMGDKIAAVPIEAALRDALGARDVCVFSAPGADGEAVHVAVQLGRTISPDDLRAALAVALPGIAQVRVHAVEAFPRNHIGKIERAALKAQLLSVA